MRENRSHGQRTGRTDGGADGSVGDPAAGLPRSRNRSTGPGRGVRGHLLWYAYLLHRLSGLGLALFLPVHFLVLSLALEGGGRLDEALALAELPWVKAGEVVLVFLFGVHLLGGIRILFLEWTPWRLPHRRLAVAAVMVAIVIAAAFWVRAT